MSQAVGPVSTQRTPTRMPLGSKVTAIWLGALLVAVVKLGKATSSRSTLASRFSA